MARGPRLSVAGVPVTIEPTFFVVLVLLGLPQPWFRVVTWVAIATVSVLVHELGHAVAFRAYGIRPTIRLHGFGGLTSGSGELGRGQHIVVSLAGPLSALVLFGLPAAAVLWAGDVPAGDTRAVLLQVVWINVGWSLLNLLPILPLDGGQVFLDVCDLATGGRGRRAAEVVSVVVAVGLALWALAAGLVFGAVLAGAFAALNLAALRKVRQDELGDRLADAHRALLQHRPAEAEPIVREVLAARPGAEVRPWAAELLGWSLLLQGDPAGGVAAVGSAAAAVAPSSALRAAVALLEGRRDEGEAVAAWVYAHDPVSLPKSLLAVAVGRARSAEAIAVHLVLMGDEGQAGARVLRDLLAYVGERDQAVAVDAVLRSRT